MKIKNLILVFLFAIAGHQSVKAQAFSQELGLVAGPLQFKSDYGLRGNSETNFGNVGFGIALAHFINFSYRDDCECFAKDTYFNDHFKVRTELSYHVTALDHYGKEAESNSLPGRQLRAMHGKARVFELGSHLEWYPRSIIDFDGGSFNFAPFLGIGIHYVNFNPSAETDLPGRIGQPSNTFYDFVAPPGEEPYIDASGGSTYAIALGAGTRYRLNATGDLIIEFRAHYYGSDFVDGLNHDKPQNKYNDWIAWINFGYVYYF